MTCSFFRPSILIGRLIELNKKLNGINPDEIVENLEPKFFNMLLKQRVFDKGVKLKSFKITKGKYNIEDKTQSSSQFSARDYEDLVDDSESANEGKVETTHVKVEKHEKLIEDKDNLKEALEKQTLTLDRKSVV